jgi:zinc/manganese transport system permease protein
MAALVVIARPLLFASINPQVAEAKGVPVRALGVVFMVMLAVVITMAVQVVGTLLLFALVVTPAATAIAITARPGAVIAIGTGVGLVAVWAGLVLSAMFNLPPSFPIVTIAFAGWLLTLALTRESRRRSRIENTAHHDHHHPHHAVDPADLSL